MIVNFSQHTTAGVPLLIARTDNAPGRPAVLWYHGFGVDKETHRKELEQFARAGFVAVGVDAPSHGARRGADLDACIDGTQAQAEHMVIDVARRAGSELASIIAFLVEEATADSSRVAVAGVSMGGYIVYQAVVAEPALRAAVAILGSPVWPGRDDCPALQPHAFCRTPTLSIVAQHDTSVPPAGARALHHSINGQCPASPSEFLELPDAVHLMSADDWATTMQRTIDWLVTHTGEAS